jgi:hypothetical protein
MTERDLSEDAPTLVKQSAIFRFEDKVKTCLLGEENKPLRIMIKLLKEKLYTAPASSKKAYHGAFEGGLIVHIMHVLDIALKLRDTLEVKVTDESLFKVVLFHDLAKLGDGEQDQYTITDERWKNERGQFYDYNTSLVKMTVPLRSLWLANKYGVVLSQEEWQAVGGSDGQYVWSGEDFAHGETPLLLLLHYADYWSAHIDGV